MRNSTSFVVNVCPILFCEQVLVDPEHSSLCKNDRAVLLLPQALLVDATAEIVSLSTRNLQDCGAQFLVRDVRFPCRLGKPCRFQRPHGFLSSIHHNSIVALGATFCGPMSIHFPLRRYVDCTCREQEWRTRHGVKTAAAIAEQDGCSNFCPHRESAGHRSEHEVGDHRHAARKKRNNRSYRTTESRADAAD